MIKKTNEQFLSEIKTINNGRYEILEEYKGAREKIKIRCKSCNNVWFNSPTHLLSGQGCPYCAGKYKTSESFNNELKQKYGSKYELLSEYIDSKSKVLILNNECRHKYEISPDNLLRGKGCPKCRHKSLSNARKNNTEDIILMIKKTIGEQYEYINGYKNSKSKIRIKHNECNKVFEISFNSLYKGRCYCGCEKREKILKKLDDESHSRSNDRITCKNDFIKYINKHAKREYIVVGEFTKSINKIKMIHKKCGKETMISPHSFKNGVRCLNCNEYKGEKKVKDFLNRNDIEFIEQFRFDDCRYKKPLPFDFYLPKLNVLIEFDGEQHDRPIERWGGEKAFILQKKRDLIKDEYCINKKIKLIRIKYYENIEKKLEQLL